MKNIFLILLTVGFFSCTKEKQPTNIENSRIHSYQFTRDIWVFDETNTGKVLLTISTDNMDILEEFDQGSLSLDLLPPVIPNNLPNKILITKELVNSIPDIEIVLKDVILPSNCNGFRLINSATRLKSQNEYAEYGYYYLGCYGVKVVNESSNEKTVRIGVLWTGNQWFYDNILSTNLPYLHDECGVDLSGVVYYKMRVTVSGDGFQSIIWYINAE
jgi:hypothetical protein